MNRNRWFALGAGLLALLVAMAVIRSGAGTRPDPRTARKKSPVRKGYFVPPKKAEASASPEVIAVAMDEARVRSTYQNYRNAVAIGHRRLQECFRKALLRNADQAIRIAEQDLTTASNHRQKDIARKALEGLRP